MPVKSCFDSEIKVIGEYRAELGETPVWCNQSHSLLWVDIIQQKLLRHYPKTNHTEIHTLPYLTSAALLTTQTEQFLLVTQSGIYLYDYRCQSLNQLCPYPEPERNTRPNEAAIAPDGALWFGTMDVTGCTALGSWYRYQNGDQAAVKVTGLLHDHVHIPNTLIWHQQQIWFADTALSCFFCAEPNQSPQQPHHLDRIIAHTIPSASPDGSCLTHQDLLINAHWGKSCLDLYRLKNKEIQFDYAVPLPVTQPSSCAFGGEYLNDLYVTSAKIGLDSASATDGGLLKIHTALQGCPTPRFSQGNR